MAKTKTADAADPKTPPAEPSKAALKAPTDQYLEALKSELQSLYGPQDQQIRRMREMREGTWKVPLDDDYRLVDFSIVDPTIADECQRIPATLSLNRPKLQVTPAGEGDAALENATLREHWTEETLWVSGTRTPGVDTFNALVDAVAADGGGWTKILFDKDLWEERYSCRPEDDTEDPDENSRLRHEYERATEEAKRGAGPPFKWVHVDTLSVYPVWTGGRLSEVLEVQERPCIQTFRQYRLGLKDGEIVPEELGEPESDWHVTPGTTVEFLEHWDDTYVTYYVVGGKTSGLKGGTVVQQWKHGYGRVPYFYAPGFVLNYWRNRKVGHGISQIKVALVEFRSFLWTLHAQVAARDTLPPIAHTIPATAAPVLGNDGNPKRSENWKLRELIHLQPGEGLSVMEFPQVAQALREEIALVSEAIEKLESPRVTSLEGLEGAGFAINQVLTESRIRFDPLSQSIERCLEEITRFLWKLVREKVGERVWVYVDRGKSTKWRGAGPEDLTDSVRIKWNLDPERPAGQLIEARYWHERVRAGTASLDQAVEAMGDNPDEVRLGRDLDRLRQRPWYLEYKERHILQKLNRGDLLRKAAEMAAVTGQLPGMGMTPNPMGQTGMPPDAGNLALAPGGAGAAPAPQGPPNGAVVGAGPGAVVPTAGGTAAIQSLNVGR